jgi:hypothetical protein
MQSNGNVVVSIRCSIHSVSVSVQYASNIIAHFVFDNSFWLAYVQWKWKLPRQHMSRLICSKMDAVNYSGHGKLFYFMLNFFNETYKILEW